MKRSEDFSCSLFKLRLKFVQTTRVVCTDFAEVLTLGSTPFIFRSRTRSFFMNKKRVVNEPF